MPLKKDKIILKNIVFVVIVIVAYFDSNRSMKLSLLFQKVFCIRSPIFCILVKSNGVRQSVFWVGFFVCVHVTKVCKEIILSWMKAEEHETHACFPKICLHRNLQ